MAHSLLIRGASVSLTFLLLLPTFAAAAGPSPVGTLRSNGSVFVDSTIVPSESSLFSGDRVRTEAGRASLALAHGSSVLFEPASSAVLQKTPEGLFIGLEKGRLTLNSNPQSPIQVETGGIALLPEGKFPSLAEVAMMGDGSMLLAVHRGAVSVRNAQEEPIVVKAGNFISVGPQTVRQKETPGTAAHGSKTISQAAKGIHIGSLSHTATVAVIGGVVAAAAVAVAIPLAVSDEEASPSTP